MAARNESWYKVVSNSSVLRRHLNDVGGRMSLSKMLNVITIIVSKMTTRLFSYLYSACTWRVTVWVLHKRMKSQKAGGIGKWEEMWFKTTAEDGERGAAVTCDGRLFHRRAAATGNALSPTVDRRVRWTSRDVDEARQRWKSVAGTCSSHSCDIMSTMFLLCYVRWSFCGCCVFLLTEGTGEYDGEIIKDLGQ